MNAGTIRQRQAIERYVAVERTLRSEHRASVPDFRATANAGRLRGIRTIRPKPEPKTPDDTLLGWLVLTLLVIAVFAVLALVRYPEIMADPQWRSASTLAPATPDSLPYPPFPLGLVVGANLSLENTQWLS